LLFNIKDELLDSSRHVLTLDMAALYCNIRLENEGESFCLSCSEFALLFNIRGALLDSSRHVLTLDMAALYCNVCLEDEGERFRHALG
jgi:hypothetical protein